MAKPVKIPRKIAFFIEKQEINLNAKRTDSAKKKVNRVSLWTRWAVIKLFGLKITKACSKKPYLLVKNIKICLDISPVE